MELSALLEYQAVRNWLDGLREHWGGDPETDDPDRLPTLEAFCRYAAADPDTIIGECMRVDKAGDRRISVKGRRGPGLVQTPVPFPPVGRGNFHHSTKKAPRWTFLQKYSALAVADPKGDATP